MREYAIRLISGATIDSLRTFSDAIELADKNPRYNLLYKKNQASPLSEQETEEAGYLLNEYTCKKHHKEFDQSLNQYGKDLVIISFEDVYCKRCAMVNSILDRISKKYNLQLNIINPDNLNTYLKSNGLDGDAVNLLVQEFNDKDLKINILKKGNIPILAYGIRYRLVIPFVPRIGHVKKDCDVFMPLASFAKYSE